MKKEQVPEVHNSDEKYKAALQQQMRGLNSMNSKAEQARAKVREQEIKQTSVEQQGYRKSSGGWQGYDINDVRSAAECDMRERGIDRASEVRKWLQGNWEWNGTIDGYRNSCRLGVSDDYAVLATPRGVLDQGKITIDFEDKTIHFGSTYINFDYENGRLGDFSNGMYYRKMSRSSGSDSRSFYSSSSSSYSSTTFHTSTEVLSYTGGKFRDRSGNVISIRQEGIYANGGYPRGQLITNAVKVVRFDATSALLTTSSPYGGGGAMYIRVDASQGTITDGSGCVYYKQ